MTTEPSESFTIEEGALIRRVVPRRGTPYEHACTKQVFLAVACAVEAFEHNDAAFTGETIRKLTGAPHTQIHTALAFFKERGCVIPTRGRRWRAACDFVYEDALIEWHALREGAPGSS